MNLYEISAQLSEALENVEVNPDTGEVSGVEALDALDQAFEDKAEGLACYIKGLAAEAEAIKTEKATLAKRQQLTEKKTERLKAYLAGCMNDAGKTKLRTPRCSISFRKSERVEAPDANALPKEFQRITTEPDKAALKAALKDGQKIEGAWLETRMSILVR